MRQRRGSRWRGCDPLLHLCQRLHSNEVNWSALSVPPFRSRQVNVSVIEAGHGEGTMQVNCLCIRSTQFQDGCFRADCGISDKETSPHRSLAACESHAHSSL